MVLIEFIQNLLEKEIKLDLLLALFPPLTY